jgi:hypothetical protein
MQRYNLPSADTIIHELLNDWEKGHKLPDMVWGDRLTQYLSERLNQDGSQAYCFNPDYVRSVVRQRANWRYYPDMDLYRVEKTYRKRGYTPLPSRVSVSAS